MLKKLEKIRHSLSHIMAATVEELYPKVKFGIGPAIENGFYYDFDNLKISDDNLGKVEEKMQKLIKKDLKFKKKTISKNEAEEIFKNQPYKLELINSKLKTQNSKPQLKTKNLTIYKLASFVDLCAGPHVKSTKEINPNGFKLTKIAGAYWRGNEKNPMLTRIYGVAFKTEKELNDYLEKQQEIKKRDHRKIAQELDLYSISDEVGPGLVLWHPKSAIIIGLIEEFWKKEHQKRGYEYVISPHIGKIDLWQKSGHWDFYRENMYSPIEIDKVAYILKPMNCPFHVQIYKSQIRSYKDLPIRYCELGTVYRYEKPGVLHGLLRVRGFTQDDAHIFCQPNQLTEEILAVIDLALFMLKTFGFEKYQIDLSVREPKHKEKYLGDDKIWDKAENALEYALKQRGLKFNRAEGEAVFYGPKIDIKLIDALERAWQGPTIQVDFNFPEKFDINYIDNNGKKKRTAMIHRTILGSMERFFGVLLEHYAGNLPLWLAPVQAWIIPIGSAHKKYANSVGTALCDHPGQTHRSAPTKIRYEIKDENETVSKKIREGEMQKIPYLLVVGDDEMKSDSVRVRQREKGDLGIMKIDRFLEKIRIEIENKN